MKIPLRVALFLAIGLIAASQSGNLIRLGDAHAVAIAAWRLGLASLFLLPLAWGRLHELRSLDGSDRNLLILAGAALAGHFFAWIAAVQNTTVANAATFFAINPVLTAGAGWLFYREPITPRFAISIALGLCGVAIMGASDFRLQPDHLFGDALAVLCSILFTAYFLLGKRVRRTLDNRVYVTSLYGVAAVVSFATLALLGLPLTDYDSRTWLCFLLMALIPTMIGHTSLNYALRYIAAGRISTLTLTEPFMAGLVAWYAWDEAIRLSTAIGYVLVSLSVLVLFMDSDRTGVNPSA
jgi:drug/metabolite transporter (DMT)-like permease